MGKQINFKDVDKGDYEYNNLMKDSINSFLVGKKVVSVETLGAKIRFWYITD